MEQNSSEKVSENQKNRQHPRPKMKQLPTDCFNKRMIRLLSSDAWAALTAGISTVPIEVVSAEGKGCMAEPFLSILRKGEALPKKSFRRFLKSRDGGRLNALE